MSDNQVENGDIISPEQEERALRKKIKGTSTSGLKEKYRRKKELNVMATRFLDEYLSVEQLERFGSCGEWVQFATTENFDAAKVFRAQMCNHRFCPLCNMRKALKDAMKISVIMEALEREKKQEFIFLTLTIPNCTADELPNKLDDMNKAIKRLFERKRVKDSINGYIRKIEVTTDQAKTIHKGWYKKRQEYCEKRGLNIGDPNPNYDTFHPHAHFIGVVGGEYFSKRSEKYITQAEWAEMWREVTGEAEVIVDVRKVQSRYGETAVQEIAKYSAKDSDLYYSKSVFMVYLTSLRGRQLLTYNGLAKEYAKRFKDGELDYILDEKHQKRRDTQRELNEIPTIYTKMLNGKWGTRLTRKQREVRDYALRLKDMTEQQINEINDIRDLELAREIEDKIKGDET